MKTISEVAEVVKKTISELVAEVVKNKNNLRTYYRSVEKQSRNFLLK
jgi:hypothetical protein